jgi:hypothetical protein
VRNVRTVENIQIRERKTEVIPTFLTFLTFPYRLT